MSLDAEIRRDTNPTPTRFLLECGAFTPGLGFNLESYNPFDASLKFLNTGTPKTELNPFDSSFRTPSTTISVKNNNNAAAISRVIAHQNEKLQQKRSSWSDIMFDEVSMPMPQMSPGLSPSSTFTSASPSPPIRSPPTQTISLSQSQFHPSMAIEPHATHSHTYDHNTAFDNLVSTKKLRHSDTDFAPQESYHPDFRNSCEDEEYDENDDDNDDIDEHDAQYEQDLINRRCSGVSTVEAAMSALDMRRLSTMSDIHSSAGSMEIMNNEEAPKTSKTSKTSKTAKSKKATATSSKTSASSRKAKNASTTKSGSRKRSSSEEETPESKRQKFLERNRMAASKCREKKRLQTLKTISDADEITARNQALHETLDQLQEEVRHLKNQILSHRDCGCDVIQKFVQGSFEFSAPSSTSPVYAMPQPSVPPMLLY
ncbi:Cyclic AMP-dependent transcription factor ATF-7 [Mortierella sp. AD094]|nr:Cyclic AMP-dependent transcription factor ATF-7 [Mortierella sp. AD094]